MIHPASAGEERKQSWSSGIVIFLSRERRQTGKKADHIGERTEKLSFAERTNLPYRPPLLALYKKKPAGSAKS